MPFRPHTYIHKQLSTRETFEFNASTLLNLPGPDTNVVVTDALYCWLTGRGSG